MVMPSISNSASARTTSPALAPSYRSEPSTTPRGFSAPAARQVQVPSGRALVSSMSILRAMTAQPTTLVACRSGWGARVRSRRCAPSRSSSCTASPRRSSATGGSRGGLDLLAEAGRQVIPLDLLGHGTAAKPHDPAAYADLEASVTAALPAGEVVDAVGFSLGAQLLLAVASRQPERFGRLVVGGVGANLFATGDVEPVARAVERGDAGAEDPSLARAFAQFASAPGNDGAALAACLRRPQRRLRPEDLAGLTRPVLVVLGDRDFAGPADPLMAALPDARLVTLRGADHFGTPKDFRFLDAALDFLDAAPH